MLVAWTHVATFGTNLAVGEERKCYDEIFRGLQSLRHISEHVLSLLATPFMLILPCPRRSGTPAQASFCLTSRVSYEPSYAVEPLTHHPGDLHSMEPCQNSSGGYDFVPKKNTNGGIPIRLSRTDGLDTLMPVQKIGAVSGSGKGHRVLARRRRRR